MARLSAPVRFTHHHLPPSSITKLCRRARIPPDSSWAAGHAAGYVHRFHVTARCPLARMMTHAEGQQWNPRLRLPLQWCTCMRVEGCLTSCLPDSWCGDWSSELQHTRLKTCVSQ